MFKPKKTIPKLAAAALALTGCGGDGGGTGGTGGTGGDNEFDTSLSAFCMNVDVPCYGYTMQQCTVYYNAVIDYNNDPQCTAALISYFNCGATKTCDQIYAGACLAEYAAVWDPDDGACDEPF